MSDRKQRAYRALIVQREAFLWACFAQETTQETKRQLLSCAPIEAGISPQCIDQKGRSLIRAHARKAAVPAISASLAQGILRIVTIPIEYAAFVYEALRLTQELVYLYTGIRQEQLLSHHQLPGYLSIFFGSTFALKASSLGLEALIEVSLRRFLRGRATGMVPVVGGAVNTAFTYTAFCQLAETFQQELVKRREEHQTYLTIGWEEHEGIRMPLFSIDT